MSKIVIVVCPELIKACLQRPRENWIEDIIRPIAAKNHFLIAMDTHQRMHAEYLAIQDHEDVWFQIYQKILDREGELIDPVDVGIEPSNLCDLIERLAVCKKGGNEVASWTGNSYSDCDVRELDRFDFHCLIWPSQPTFGGSEPSEASQPLLAGSKKDGIEVKIDVKNTGPGASQVIVKPKEAVSLENNASAAPQDEDLERALDLVVEEARASGRDDLIQLATKLRIEALGDSPDKSEARHLWNQLSNSIPHLASISVIASSLATILG